MSNPVSPEPQNGIPSDSNAQSGAPAGSDPASSAQAGVPQSPAYQSAQLPQQAYAAPQQSAAPPSAQPGFQQQAQAQFQNLLAKPSPHFPTNVRNILGGLSAATVVVTLLAMFTPFVSISVWGYSNSMSLAGSRDGAFFWILLIGTIAATVLVFLQDKVAKGVMWVIPSVAIVGALMGFGEALGNNEVFDYGASRGFGYFMVLIDALLFIAIAIYSIMSLVKKEPAAASAFPAYGGPQQFPQAHQAQQGYPAPQQWQANQAQPPAGPQPYAAPQQQFPQAHQAQQGYSVPQQPQVPTPQPQAPQGYSASQQPQQSAGPQNPDSGQSQA
ncbi:MULTISPECIES: hypothetical protein [unclassified Actinomyces]|uniref:hypothetical protein n=1 Tax=unclassified Actinomyces TaxID=2609248 RepID=UPI0011BFBBFA|nr:MULTISPECIES: hypothetical protein [unclassified Actinomyces]